MASTDRALQITTGPVRRFLTRLRGLFRPPAPPGVTSQTGFEDLYAWMSGQHGVPWAVEHSRRATHRDIERMLETDEILAMGLRIWADFVTAPNADDEVTLKIDCEDDKITEILDEMIARCGLDETIWQLVHDGVAYGNQFPENVLGPVDGKLGLVDLKPLPEQQMYRQIDSRGRLGYNDKGEEVPPYLQRAQPGSGPAVYFQRWQITHFAMPPKRTGGYGTGLLAPARRDWKLLQYLEDSMGLARIQRAYGKLAHHIPMPMGLSPAEVRSYIDLYKKGVERTDVIDWRSSERLPASVKEPMAVDRDFYLPRFYTTAGQMIAGEIQSIDPRNEQLQQINDVEYLQNRVLVGLGVPKALLGLERDVNAKATLTEQGRQFARRVQSYQKRMQKGLHEICDLELLLNGYTPGQVEYQIRFPTVNVRDEEVDATVAQIKAETARLLKEMNAIDSEAARTHYTDLTDEEAEEIKQRIEAEAESELPGPERGGTQFPAQGAFPSASTEEIREYVQSGRAGSELAAVVGAIEDLYGTERVRDDEALVAP